jgi:hypothetical protein
MDERAERVERFFTWPVIVAALLVIPVIVIEQSAAGDPLKTLASVMNWIIWLVFAAELVNGHHHSLLAHRLVESPSRTSP